MRCLSGVHNLINFNKGEKVLCPVHQNDKLGIVGKMTRQGVESQYRKAQIGATIEQLLSLPNVPLYAVNLDTDMEAALRENGIRFSRIKAEQPENEDADWYKPVLKSLQLQR